MVFTVSSSRRCQSSQPLEIPAPSTEPLVVSPKIENLVTEIGKLTLIEASELNTALKQKFNLPDFSASFGAATAGKAEAEVITRILPLYVKDKGLLYCCLLRSKMGLRGSFLHAFHSPLFGSECNSLSLR